nr:MAG TPA: plasma serine protease inhibitor, N-, protease, inhibitor, heparin, retinoic [Caudoviricetes sp.]
MEHHADKPFTFAIKQQQLFLSNTAARMGRRDTPIKLIG